MSFLDKVWYKKLGVLNAPVILPLLPLSAAFSLISRIRRERYKSGKKYSVKARVKAVYKDVEYVSKWSKTVTYKIK